MHIVAVRIVVKPERVQDFIAQTRKNHENTRREAGNLRFDVLQKPDDPAHFMLYEVYRRKEDHASHQQTAHYAEWKERVADWMAQPREGIHYKSLFPGEDPEAW